MPALSPDCSGNPCLRGSANKIVAESGAMFPKKQNVSASNKNK